MQNSVRMGSLRISYARSILEERECSIGSNIDAPQTIEIPIRIVYCCVAQALPQLSPRLDSE